MLRFLPTFVIVAEERHFRRSAKILGISQSAVSRQIFELESSLGFTLLSRKTRHVQLTEAGAQFLQEAKSILHQLEAAVTSSRAVAYGNTGIVRIGYTQASMTTYVATVLKKLRATLPPIGVELHEMRTNDQVEALLNQQIDIGFLHPPIATVGLKLLEVGNDPIVVCFNRGHSLCNQETVAMSDLQDSPYVLYPREIGPHLYDEIIKQCEGAGYSPHIAQHCTSWSTAIDLAAEGIGVTLVPRAYAGSSANGNVVFKSIEYSSLRLPMAIASKRKSHRAFVAEYLREAHKQATVTLADQAES